MRLFLKLSMPPPAKSMEIDPVGKDKDGTLPPPAKDKEIGPVDKDKDKDGSDSSFSSIQSIEVDGVGVTGEGKQRKEANRMKGLDPVESIAYIMKHENVKAVDMNRMLVATNEDLREFIKKKTGDKLPLKQNLNKVELLTKIQEGMESKKIIIWTDIN